MKLDLQAIKDFWPVSVSVVGFIGACFVFPFKLEAMESRQEKFEQTQERLIEQTTMIGEYVKGQETEKAHEKELQASAPPGYRWDSTIREYVQK